MAPKQGGKGARGPAAYMLFAQERRAAVQAELQAAGVKASVAEVGRALGEQWGKLSEEGKQRYKDLAAQRAQELREATQAQDAEPGSIPQPEGGAQEGAEQTEATTSSALPFGFPTSLVRKIALVDGDVQRIGADAVRALAKATELFVELLALKAAEVARSGKRKNFKFQDIVAAAKRDRRLLDMGLPDVLEKDPVFAEVHGRAEDENQLREANQRKAADKEQQKGLQQITSFFSAAPTAAAAGPAAAAEPASG